MDEFDFISHKLMIFAGILMYIFGSIGNILNICVFTKWCRSKNKSKSSFPCGASNSSLYLLGSSISNLIVIIYPLLTRILLDGYELDTTERNEFLICKLRYFILHTFDLTSLACICLATFDRYLISSREVRLRKLITTRRRTQSIILILVVLFGIHSIPVLKYYRVSKAGYCTIVSITYSYYYLYTFQIVLHGIIPIIFLSVFGLLTLRQLRIISKRKNRYGLNNSDKQLSRMLLLLSLAIVLSSIPYCIEQSYYVLFNGNDRKQTSVFFLFHVTCSILFYANPVSSFYVYYISTRNFRVQVHQILFARRNTDYVVFYQIKPMTTATQSARESLV
ncbi:unnamed protein product [Rotaria magnacalcarata]|uniref:G-protein coupled receptors family 1 profile domain-containing protein n=2 Tax=Rotaria magnacalcarata TaxID=392030 RepID=A0A816TJZ1_9BILA|nr:unnamed protein product [Rotaria magnacalcarata]CAF2092835.1 unnamed protein product [Rotaria magnacalcarata]CAF3964410.1 unnamed protein product [Rotaria magnacalcarata]CAF4041748.1 unnamed protein product [Rotaria magnacalcarata]